MEVEELFQFEKLNEFCTTDMAQKRLIEHWSTAKHEPEPNFFLKRRKKSKITLKNLQYCESEA